MSVSRYVLIDGNGFVVGIVLWDGVADMVLPNGVTASLASTLPASVDINWQTTDGGKTWAPSQQLLAQQALQNNASTIQANVAKNMAVIQAWIQANPAGATLTAAQTLVLAKMLYGIGLIIEQQASSTAGT